MIVMVVRGGGGGGGGKGSLKWCQKQSFVLMFFHVSMCPYSVIKIMDISIIQGSFIMNEVPIMSNAQSKLVSHQSKKLHGYTPRTSPECPGIFPHPYRRNPKSACIIQDVRQTVPGYTACFGP